MRQGTRTGGWSQSAQLRVGTEDAMAFQVDFVGSDQDLKSDRRQRPASMYTVSFDVNTVGLILPPGLLGARPFQMVNPVADVEFSTEGNIVRRRLSVVSGASISGPADSIDVRVRDQTTDSDGLPVPVASRLPYTVSVLATPGTRAARHAPPFLMANNVPITAGPGAGTNVEIPISVGIVTVCVFASGVGGPLPEVRQLDYAGATLVAYVPLNPTFVPLHPRAAFVRVENDGPAGSSATFSVFFGVDG